MSAKVTPNQSYLMKQMQYKLAAALGCIMHGQGANVKSSPSGYPWKDPQNTLWWPSAWRKTAQIFKTRLQRSVSGYHACIIEFKNARWDSQHSDLDYGPKSIDTKVDEQDEGKSKIIRNNTDSPVHVAYEESVDLTNSFSSTITKGVTLDVTKDASVDTSLTVSGGYAGVSAEASVAAHFGVSQSKAESTEEGKEESEEGTKSESLAIDFDAKPRSYYLVEIKKENERTSQPFAIDGVMDFDIHLTYFSLHGSKESRWHRSFSGVAELEQYLRGYDTDHPEMAHFWDKAYSRVKRSLAFVLDPENRRIQVSGTSNASLDSNATYDVELLGNHVPDALDHLPVVDSNDV